jgi:predicted Na+-dependent transporter
VEHEVSQLAPDFVGLLCENCIGEFIKFLNGQWPKAFHGLLAVPWALFAKLIHNGKQSIESIQC